jgi:ABC-type Zn uptake system ZnuABC Zn-binding protein ZnuA
LAILAALLVSISACGPSEPAVISESASHQGRENENGLPLFAAVLLGPGEKPKLVATTSIVADVVRNIGGDQIDLITLMPLGADPHTFEPTPRDVSAVSDAHALFANGAGLEAFLEPLLESADAQDKIVEVSRSIGLLEFGGERRPQNEHDHDSGDPHTWTNPKNVLVWVDNIKRALIALDPSNAGIYEANAEAYTAELVELDGWIREQVGQIPTEKRQLVTDHQFFAYFADAYGFTQVGAIVPAYSTVAEPSARELAELEDAIKELGAKAVFVGKTVNPSLGQRVAEDTGTRLVFLHTGSLTEPGGDADSYLVYMRRNVQAIVDALK